jgi:hydroxymethylglutaryl-CoA reductase (NADPH)
MAAALLSHATRVLAHDGLRGKGKALKLCEIAAALVVAGELSLSGAARVDKKTRTNEWVDAHERLGRNR